MKQALQKPAQAEFKLPNYNKKNVIYQIPCANATCSATYIGQSEQKLVHRLQSHKSNFKLKDQSNSLVQHFNSTGHEPNISGTNILFQIPNWRTRTNLETLCISVNSPQVHNHILPNNNKFKEYIDLLKKYHITKFRHQGALNKAI